jgi:biotin carboxyl carrier protein
MHLELIGPSKKYELGAEKSDDEIVVSVEGKKVNAKIQPGGVENSYIVHIERRSLSVRIEEETASSITLTLDGETVTFRRPGVGAPSPKLAEPQAMKIEARALHSPIAGKIVSVQVKAGMVVKAGSPIIMIESMKMESVIRSDRDGKINQVLVKKGDAVSTGQVIVRFT